MSIDYLSTPYFTPNCNYANQARKKLLGLKFGIQAIKKNFQFKVFAQSTEVSVSKETVVLKFKSFDLGNNVLL